MQYNLEQKLSSGGKKYLHFYTITQEENIAQNTPLTILEKQCSNKVYSIRKLEGTFENAIEANQALISLQVNGVRFSLIGFAQEMVGKRPQKYAKVSVDLSFEQCLGLGSMHPCLYGKIWPHFGRVERNSIQQKWQDDLPLLI